jgi:Ca2+-binding RTX toxin-like protein
VSGNGLGNSLYGMRGNDTLSGLDGTDRLFGGVGNDRLNGGSGNDQLYGGTGNDTIKGDAGNDQLWGGGGTDSLRGGTGNDLYFHSNGATIFEASNAGLDKVIAYVSQTLAANVEFLEFAGSAGARGVGNGLNNVIIGNSGANAIGGGAGNDLLSGRNGDDRLFGDTGNDTLNGGLGNDTLIGASGRDVFQFTTAPSASNVDVIADFVRGQDRVHLENAVFAGLSAGVLAATAFTANRQGIALDSRDRVIYETDVGNLWFDANGSASGGRVLIAQMADGLGLAASDIFVI